MRFVILAALLSLPAPGNAHEYTLGKLEVIHPWARATPTRATVAGGYLTVKNSGPFEDNLIGGSSPFAERLEFHESTIENGVARMRPLTTVPLGPMSTTEFKPGGLHIMFVKPVKPLRDGERIEATLVFEKAGAVSVEFAIYPLGGSPGVPGHQHHP